ncbi:Hypothetical protein DEACI_4154 [Acididesulfobacillus acetoxydans]|uniref:Uncharacterized protein n=1 Tax=Acididesulfobacillus acetoxydans TaxID=1561005 RepID=A0A8S0X1X4_9FIRM|nr:hypothetical protein [Acididesulfobacillus acetoxydans]CAA7603331.1 Hypothetical protein DEACI_4154 [Acididesulfobacillus acetoxydans]CEJ09674.1 Hypothetical protein DEACI_4159 [Acididesulfobacillus acetoxydans]
MIVLLLALFSGIILFEVLGLVKKKMWRELVVFSVYMSLGASLSILEVLGIDVPNPGKGIEALLKPLTELLK